MIFGEKRNLEGFPPLLTSTVKGQWEAIKQQLMAGLIEKERKTMGEKYDIIWEELRRQKQVPEDTEKYQLLPHLITAVQHTQIELEQLEYKRSCLYNMSLASAALEFAQTKSETCPENRILLTQNSPASITLPPAPPSYFVSETEEEKQASTEIAEQCQKAAEEETCSLDGRNKLQTVCNLLESDTKEKEAYCVTSDKKNVLKVGGMREILQPQPVSQHMFPLICKGPKAEEVYQPFSFTDMNGILDKMPHPSEGGGVWMAKFLQLTQGNKLAMGDWRAILEKQIPYDIRQIETNAGTINLEDSQPFTTHATQLGGAMRARFPIPIDACSFTMKENEDILEFLKRCKDTWAEITGCHPGSGKWQTYQFRKAIIASMPKTVQEAMLDNPDMPGCTTEQWENHLKHNMKRHRDKERDNKEDTETARAELLKLQLEEARKRINDIENKSEDQMVQQPFPQVKRGPGEWGRRHETGWRMLWDTCHVCGQRGHWRRMCPHMKWQGIPWTLNEYGGGYGYAQQPPYPPTRPLSHPGAMFNHWRDRTHWGPMHWVARTHSRIRRRLSGYHAVPKPHLTPQ